MQIHAPHKVVHVIKVDHFGNLGAIALTFADGMHLVLEDASDDMDLISAMAEVRRLRAIDARLVPPAPYEMPLPLVGGEA